VVAAAAAAAAFTCRPAPGLGSVAYTRAAKRHVVELATCEDTVIGTVSHPTQARLAGPNGAVAVVRASGRGKTAKQTIYANGRPIFSETQSYKTIGPGDTPGPIMLLSWSGDGRWVFFTIDPGGSASIAADGLILRVVSARGGAVHKLGPALAYSDYLSWCAGRIVFTGGGDRLAWHNKRLLTASPPDWRARPLAPDRGRAWGAVTCAPGGNAVVVQSQRENNDATFSHARWALWQIGFDGAERRLTAPPPRTADESPRFAGNTLLFVRTRRAHGTLFALRNGRTAGPFAELGFNLGYYGHHDWPFAPRP
jgi:hypothetical protein